MRVKVETALALMSQDEYKHSYGAQIHASGLTGPESLASTLIALPPLSNHVSDQPSQC
jgi:hypothetical protein